jgi:hypothetical protein
MYDPMNLDPARPLSESRSAAPAGAQPGGRSLMSFRATADRSALHRLIALAVACAAVFVAAGASAPAAGANGCVSTKTATFQQANRNAPVEQCYQVPAGITRIRVTAIGARAMGGWFYDDSASARAQGTLDVTPGDVLYVNVGVPGVSRTGGWNGGGDGGTGAQPGYGGGGATDVRTCPRNVCLITGFDASYDTRLIVAAAAAAVAAGRTAVRQVPPANRAARGSGASPTTAAAAPALRPPAGTAATAPAGRPARQGPSARAATAPRATRPAPAAEAEGCTAAVAARTASGKAPSTRLVAAAGRAAFRRAAPSRCRRRVRPG